MNGEARRSVCVRVVFLLGFFCYQRHYFVRPPIDARRATNLYRPSLWVLCHISKVTGEVANGGGLHKTRQGSTYCRRSSPVSVRVTSSRRGVCGYVFLCVTLSSLFCRVCRVRIFCLRGGSKVMLAVPSVSLRLFDEVFGSKFAVCLTASGIPVRRRFGGVLEITLRSFYRGRLVRLFVAFVAQSLRFRFGEGVGTFLLFRRGGVVVECQGTNTMGNNFWIARMFRLLQV